MGQLPAWAGPWSLLGLGPRGAPPAPPASKTNVAKKKKKTSHSFHQLAPITCVVSLPAYFSCSPVLPSFGEALPAKNLNILMAQRLPPMDKTQMPIQEGGYQNRRNDSGLGTSLGAKNFKPVLHAHCSIHGSPHTTT